MTGPSPDSLAALAADLVARAAGSPRLMVALAGAPGSGKSTVAEALAGALEAIAPGAAVVVPMDGWHFDNAVLRARGLFARKGAPETFDVAGLAATLARIRQADGVVAVPVFDRDLDLARAGARIVAAEHRIVLVEGNYLLLDEPPWDALAPLFDRTIFVDVAEAELERRLIARWLHHGHDPERARARALGNDIPNAQRVLARSRNPDLRWLNEAADTVVARLRLA